MEDEDLEGLIRYYFVQGSVRGNYTVPFEISWKGDQPEDPSQKAKRIRVE